MINPTFINTQRVKLAKDLANLMEYEVYGIKVAKQKSWDNIYMRFLILDAMQITPCCPYTQEEENCLMNKISESCNC